MSSLFDVWKSTRGGYLPPLLSEPLFRSALEYLESHLQPQAVILDIGCGHGHATYAFATCGYRAIGVDVHFRTLQEAHSIYPRNLLFAGTVDGLPLPDHSIDGLFCFSVLQYVDRARALSECSRILRPGGRFVFVENLAGNPVAKGYRIWRKLRGIRFPEHVEPRRHLRWRERHLYEVYFSEVNFENYYIMAPLAMFSGTVQSGIGVRPATPRIQGFFRATNQVERALNRLFPFIRGICWNTVVYGTK